MKVTIVTNFKVLLKHIKKYFGSLFQDCLEIETLSFDLDELNQEIDADVLLISLYSIYVEIKKHIREDAKVIILGTTITNEQYKK